MALIYLRTSSGKKAKTARTKAQRDLAAAEEALKKKWAAAPSFAGKYTVDPKARERADRLKSLATEDEVKPKLGKFDNTVAAVKPAPQYTGSKVLGVAVMHKSSMVPVFSQQEAEDVAKMRRN